MTGTLGAPKRGSGQARFGMVIQQQRRRQKKRNCGETSWKPFTGPIGRIGWPAGMGLPMTRKKKMSHRKKKKAKNF
jgi:hypothetical protein